MQANYSISIFFPCYNDANTIGKLVNDAYKIVPKLTSDFEIIVVNDGSKDNSAEILLQLQKKHPDLKIITHPKNLGYGAALRSGFAASTKTLVFYTDGDGQYSVNELPIIYQLMTPDVDFVNGIKMTRQDSAYRIILGNLYSFIARWGFWLPITDVDCDYRLIRKSLLDKLKLTATSGNICVELTKSAQRAGASFREVSIHHYERQYGKSQFFNLGHLSSTFSGLTTLWTNLILLHKFRLPNPGRKIYFLGTFIIIIFALAMRFAPPIGNNIYFTMDQANDAVHVRELLVNHHLPLLGPETSIPGVYVGSLWYYFIAIGFGILGGHPFGGVLMLILLNIFTLYLIIHRTSKELSRARGLLIGISLLTSWAFYNISRYSFNPFPNFFLSIWGLFWLSDFTRGHKNKYLWAAIPFGLFFHTDLAPALPAVFLYVATGFIFMLTRKLPIKKYLLAMLILLAFITPHITSELSNGFPQTQTILKEAHNPGGVFSSLQVQNISNNFSIIVSRSLYRQTPELGLLIFGILMTLFFRKIQSSKVNDFTKHFVALSLILFALSWVFFITNLGWRDWQTTFLSPLIFMSVLLILTEMPTLIFLPLLLISLYSHIVTFTPVYKNNFRASGDQSLLVNEIGAIDWVYAKAAGKGFSSYNYLPSVYDYPYQYLYWWRGLGKYKYLPCEYSSFPGDPKAYMPSPKSFTAPVRDCPSPLRFLIMEPDKNEVTKNQWFTAITENTILLEETHVGNITIQKRSVVK